MALVWLVAAVIALSVGAEARELNTDREVVGDLAPRQVTKELHYCKSIPTNLGEDRFQVEVNLTQLEYRGEEDVERDPEPMMPYDFSGGVGAPNDCRSQSRVAIIVPFSHRKDVLGIFMRNLHPFLQRQNIYYGIFVVEPAEKSNYNKAKLMNVGALESLKIDNFDCYIFHDVALLPEDRRNLYTCPEEPHQLSVQVESPQSRKLPFSDLFGGVVAMSVKDFKKVNGYSNRFSGLGSSEGDYMAIRIMRKSMRITRYENHIGRYTMIPSASFNWFRRAGRPRCVLESTAGQSADGLNEVKYRIAKYEMKDYHTHIVVDFDS